MKYIVLEIQNNGDVTSLIHTVHDTYLEAQNKYHNVLAAAAVSTVDTHGAAILTSDGVEQEYRMYGHQTEEEIVEE